MSKTREDLAQELVDLPSDVLHELRKRLEEVLAERGTPPAERQLADFELEPEEEPVELDGVFVSRPEIEREIRRLRDVRNNIDDKPGAHGRGYYTGQMHVWQDLLHRVRP